MASLSRLFFFMSSLSLPFSPFLPPTHPPSLLPSLLSTRISSGCRLVLVGSPGRYSFDPVEAPVGVCSCASRPGFEHLAVRISLMLAMLVPVYVCARACVPALHPLFGLCERGGSCAVTQGVTYGKHARLTAHFAERNQRWAASIDTGPAFSAAARACGDECAELPVYLPAAQCFALSWLLSSALLVWVLRSPAKIKAELFFLFQVA